METIYARPADYDLEHYGDAEDVRFFQELARRFAPSRVLELAAGSGRVTMPLARTGVECGFDVVGLEINDAMLGQAVKKRVRAPEAVRRRVRFVRGDIRSWRAPEPFDLIVTPCSSVSHLLTIEDQLACWRMAWTNLAPGGRFVVDAAMPNLGAYAESMQTPPRTTLEIDVDTTDPVSGERLLRYKTTRYLAHEQRAEIRFLYDRFPDGQSPDRFVSDFDCHVYFPRELQLLYLQTGFDIESTWGDYFFHPLRSTSRQLIFVGRKT